MLDVGAIRRINRGRQYDDRNVSLRVAVFHRRQHVFAADLRQTQVEQKLNRDAEPERTCMGRPADGLVIAVHGNFLSDDVGVQPTAGNSNSE